MVEESMANQAMEAPAASAASESQAGMLDTVKDQFNMENMMDKIKASKDKLFEIGLYAGAGFLSGFLLKKYSTYVAVFVLMLIGIGVLQHMEVINVAVNWDKANELFGIQAAQTVSADSVISNVWEWVKVNMAISISFIVGLFIGLKVG